MATYQQIIDYVGQQFRFTIHHTSWIADVKARHWLTRVAAIRQHTSSRVAPCPSDKIVAIAAALRHFRMI